MNVKLFNSLMINITKWRLGLGLFIFILLACVIYSMTMNKAPYSFCAYKTLSGIKLSKERLDFPLKCYSPGKYNVFFNFKTQLYRFNFDLSENDIKKLYETWNMLSTDDLKMSILGTLLIHNAILPALPDSESLEDVKKFIEDTYRIPLKINVSKELKINIERKR